MRAMVLGVGLALLLACGDRSDSPVEGSDVADASSSGPMTAVDDETTASPGGSGDDAALDACAPGAAAAVQIGHGDAAYAELADGPAVIVYGPQGGFHILLGLHAQQIDASDVAVARLTGTLAGQEVGRSSPYADFSCRGETLEALGLVLIWDVTPDVLHGQTVQLEVELTDAAGTVVTATGQVVVTDPMAG